MNNFGTGFLTGFMGDQAEKIGERKAEGRDYFNKKMELAQAKALELHETYGAKMDASLQVAKQMMAVGVPEETVMAIANQNPDDLPEFYATVQEMKRQGVDMSNPEVYSGLLQVDGEFNPGNENVTSLLKRIYMPLSNNAKADPEGFGFDPKGSIWATMLGYNSMEKANARLENTEIMPGVSAADALRYNPDRLPSPLGGGTVTLNETQLGDSVRAAKKSQQGTDLSPSETRSILQTFNDIKAEIGTTTEVTGSVQEREAAINAAAAVRVLEVFPEAGGISEITRWLPQVEEAPEVIAPESPVVAPTAPVAPQATAPAVIPSTLPQRLPSGAELIQDNGDGTSTWKTTTGQTKTYSNADVMQVVQGAKAMESGPTMSEKPQPGWLSQQGSEYD